MAYRCCVAECKTIFSLTGIRRHQIPANKELRSKWIQILQLKEDKIKARTAVCGLHFKNIYVLPGKLRSRNYVPTENLPPRTNGTENLCRGCMTPILNRFVSIKDETMRNLFYKCTNLKIEENDLLPKSLCKNCFSKCSGWKNFQIQCEKSQNKFNEIIYNENSIPEQNQNESEMELDEEDETEDISGSESELEHPNVLSICEVTINQEAVPEPLKVPARMIDKNSQGNQPQNYVFKCKKCKQFFLKLEVYENHYRDKHGSELKLDNPTVSTDNQEVPEIEKIPEPLKIPVKPMIGEDSSKLPKHILQCKECKQIFKTLEVYQNHYRDKHGYKLCSICKEMFTSDELCDEHKILTHTADIFPVNFKCKICDMEFYERTAYTKHIQIHDQLTCKICKKEFNSYGSLDRHLVKMHSEPKHECKVCKIKFRDSYSLKLHSMKHTNEYVGCCQYCGKTFLILSELRRHVKLVHEAPLEKKFKCTLCPHKNKSEYGLKQHMTMHTAEKKISCEFCELKFRRKRTYINHRMTHTGEKNFYCEVCNHGFIQKQAYQTHMKVHEKI